MAAAASCRKMQLRIRTKKTKASSQLLGYMLGNALYDAYLKGRVTRGMLRRCSWFIWKSRAKPKKRIGKSPRKFAATARNSQPR